MSDRYAEENNENALELYLKRILYMRDAMGSQNNIIDFNLGEKCMYGRMGMDYSPIIPRGASVMKPITNAPPDRAVSAMNFVVDIFAEMSRQFAKCVQIGTIRQNEPFLSNLIAYNAYVPPLKTYNSYKNTYFDAVVNYFRSHNINVETFDDFMRYMDAILPKLLPQMRYTFPAYVKSRYCPMRASGLVIEIAEGQDLTNNDAKMRNFISSPNWQFFVNTCDTYGFMIDYNAPWRIVADIDSESMRKAAAAYGYAGRLGILSTPFIHPATRYFLDHFREDLLSLYNRVRKDYWTSTTVCMSGKVITKSHQSATYSVEEFKKHYDVIYFLRKYFAFRIYEEKPEWTTFQQQTLIENILTIVLDSKIKVPAINLFETLINKEFDKIGSFNYIIKAAQELAKTTGGEIAISGY